MCLPVSGMGSRLPSDGFDDVFTVEDAANESVDAGDFIKRAGRRWRWTRQPATINDAFIVALAVRRASFSRMASRMTSRDSSLGSFQEAAGVDDDGVGFTMIRE